MTAIAKLFKHGNGQAVRLPKAFRFAGSEVQIEKRGEEVVLRARARPEFKSMQELAEHLDRKFPGLTDWPDPERPQQQQVRDLTW